MAMNAPDDSAETTQFKANTMSGLTMPQVDAVKEVGCSATIGQALSPKKEQTQLEPSVFGESSDEEDDGKAGIRHHKQVQQKKTEDPTVCEFDEVCDGIEEGRKMAVAAKLGKNKELKRQDKQTEVEDRKRD